MCRNLVSVFLNKPAKLKYKYEHSKEIVLHEKSELWILRNLSYFGWNIERVTEGIVYVKKGDITIGATPRQLSVLLEPLEDEYKVFDYTNKVVLDVGGFIGYSAVLFSRWGAKRVIIYEVQKDNISIINNNLALNQVNGTEHNIAVADNDGELTLNYQEEGRTNFGLFGEHEFVVKARAASKVLTDDVDIAKFDCEGCEYSLLSVPCDIIRRVPEYVIEYHHGLDKLREKFEKCGFRVQELWKLNTPGNIGGMKAVKVK